MILFSFPRCRKQGRMRLVRSSAHVRWSQGSAASFYEWNTARGLGWRKISSKKIFGLSATCEFGEPDFFFGAKTSKIFSKFTIFIKHLLKFQFFFTRNSKNFVLGYFWVFRIVAPLARRAFLRGICLCRCWRKSWRVTKVIGCCKCRIIFDTKMLKIVS